MTKSGKYLFRQPESILTGEVDQAVVDTLAQACELSRSEVSIQTSLLELGLDSLGLTVVIAQLQTRYCFEVEPDELAELLGAAVVADIAALVKRKIGRS
jgi:acyl carrier protein